MYINQILNSKELISRISNCTIKHTNNTGYAIVITLDNHEYQVFNGNKSNCEKFNSKILDLMEQY